MVCLKKRRMLDEAAIVETAKEFTENSNIHGVGYLMSTSSCLADRLAWFCLICLREVIIKKWKVWNLSKGALSHYLANMGCEVPEIKMLLPLGGFKR